MGILDDLIARITVLEQRLDRLADVEIVPFNIGCKISNSGNITMTSGATKTLTFDTEQYDTDSMHSTTTNTSRITINTDGKYILVAAVRFDVAAGGRRQIKIRKNGSTDLSREEESSAADGTSSPHMTIAVIDSAVAGNYYETIAFQTSGSNLDIVAANNYSPYFMAARLA